ncbi:MAG: nucleoside deaminase [Eubacteriales bacterium]|nr:nucleoside deaminase [Eubacteriales bacterium]
MTDRDFMRLALDWASRDPREVPVGAVIARGGVLVSAAHNEREREAGALRHAELLAIVRAQEKLGTRRLEDCTMYVTLEPCPMCAGALILARLARLVFSAFDKQYGCCGSRYALPLDPAFHHRVACEGGLLAEESEAMLDAFFGRQREKGLM